ncbi:putative membrane protein [Synechococcus sp. BIOS-U3-1]|nr:putative membrane protein [Synechococcus sp. BIOS-U3-1]
MLQVVLDQSQWYFKQLAVVVGLLLRLTLLLVRTYKPS